MLKTKIETPKEFVDHIFSITKKTLFPGRPVEHTKTTVEVFPRFITRKDFADWIKEIDEVLE